MKTKLTQMEKLVLEACINEASGNGHDFGLSELVVKEMQKEQSFSAKQTGAILSSLVKKGIIQMHEPVFTDQLWTQFTWSFKFETRKEMIEKLQALLDCETKATRSKKSDSSIEATAQIIKSFRGLPGEFYMLKGLLCADRDMEYKGKAHKAFHSVINCSMVAQRMDEINGKSMLGDSSAEHRYYVEVMKEDFQTSVMVDANTRTQAASYAKKAGYEVCSVNMVG